jgi:hypothetical protein
LDNGSVNIRVSSPLDNGSVNIRGGWVKEKPAAAKKKFLLERPAVL